MVELNDDMVELKLLEQKAKYFFDNKKIVHVKLKNGNWDDGYIIEFFGDGFIIEHNKGYHVPCFYLQIEDITLWNTNIKEVKK